jgi:hypothetical protein
MRKFITTNIIIDLTGWEFAFYGRMRFLLAALEIFAENHGKSISQKIMGVNGVSHL